MATPQEMTSLEVVKLIEAEADEEGDILEELTNQDIKEIYQQLNPQDKKRFRQFRKFHRQYFGVYGEHLPSYHMARQVVKDLMPGLPSASADVIAEKRAELLAKDRLRELCKRHGFKFPEREMRMEAPREEAAEDPTYRFPSVQDEYQAGLTTTTEEEIGQLLGAELLEHRPVPAVTQVTMVTGMTEEQVDETTARVATELGAVQGWQHITQSFDRAQIALVLAVGVRKVEEFEILKGKRAKNDVTPFLRLAKIFGSNTRTIQECNAGIKYRYTPQERGPQREPP